ncbi:DUF4859 domain-containing protein [Labilibaculum sp. 44]|uniref:DUF4859 domain-containing protein n=2 Tax=Labilibaculum euxinus TaxID=2686357 RepID=A0A7M4D3K6_9BACT|nr:DUF4859 domain-containing protein [Labilibaculum euxinus]MVB06440.1 DUF4859 domain-containing protein [Labilibaculum euxinus]
MLFTLIIFTLFFLACSGSDLVSDEDEKGKPDSETPKADTTSFDKSKFYVPLEFKDNDYTSASSTWCYERSKQSDHFILFWAAGYGKNDPGAAEVPDNLRVDIDDLLEKAEVFYDLNVNTLKFAETGVGKSNLDQYKMQIYLFYQEEWMAFGAGYDDTIGALWVNPGTVQPVGAVIAHEIGHSFQYQTFCDLGGKVGFRYGFGGNGGNAFWEQTAQWQSFQAYPEQVFENNNFPVYCENCFRHVCHEDYRYASYFIHYYWAEKHGIDIIGKIWREAQEPEDPIEAYMRINGLTVDGLNAELYEAATKFVTWDLDALRSLGENYIGKHTYKFYQLTDGSYQVAYSKCPSSTGYNVIPLNVPTVGTVITTSFTALTPGSALAAGDPGTYTDSEISGTATNYNSSSLTRAGWRYGYVALLDNGQRVYGEMNRKTAGSVEFTVPEGCVNLWFVVLGAPSTYEAHPWDEKESNDDQWPYKLKFSNTDILGNITIDPNAAPEDLTLTYDISFAAADDYSGATVNLNANGDINKVAQAFVMQPSAISSNMLGAKETPSEGKIAFAAVESDGSLNYETTANGYGFWFDSVGGVIGWDSENDSKLFSEFSSSSFELNIGQYPGKSVAGDTYTVKESLVYTKDGTQYQVTFVMNITIK